MDCKHIYDKKVIMQYIKSTKGQQAKCPITGIYINRCFKLYIRNSLLIIVRFSQLSHLIPGCPKLLQADRVVCDPLLCIEIEEMKAMSKQSGATNIIEDFTDLNEEGEDSE